VGWAWLGPPRPGLSGSRSVGARPPAVGRPPCRAPDPSAAAGLAVAGGVRWRPLPADRAANPARRPRRPVGPRLFWLRRHRAGRLCLPGDGTRRLARRLAFPPRLYLRVLARDPALSLVPLAGAPGGVGLRTVALSPVPIDGGGGIAGGGLAADQGVVPPPVTAALGLHPLRAGWRGRRVAAE